MKNFPTTLLLPAALFFLLLPFPIYTFAEESTPEATISADDLILDSEDESDSADSDPLTSSESEVKSDEKENVSQEVLDYELPYPGILPDHPLYPLKLFRDRLLNFLIRDPGKRIEYNLLMADKRLNMGIALSEKGNWELSEEIVSKGEKYFVNAVDEIYNARDIGHDIPGDLRSRLLLSVQKHRLIVDELKAKSPENIRSGFDSSLQTISESHGRVIDFGI